MDRRATRWAAPHRASFSPPRARSCARWPHRHANPVLQRVRGDPALPRAHALRDVLRLREGLRRRDADGLPQAGLCASPPRSAPRAAQVRAVGTSMASRPMAGESMELPCRPGQGGAAAAREGDWPAQRALVGRAQLAKRLKGGLRPACHACKPAPSRTECAHTVCGCDAAAAADMRARTLHAGPARGEARHAALHQLDEVFAAVRNVLLRRAPEVLPQLSHQQAGSAVGAALR
jgi:hypothetical protein